jgi:hypothetical protein
LLVKLAISPGGQEKFLIEDFPRNANRLLHGLKLKESWSAGIHFREATT